MSRLYFIVCVRVTPNVPIMEVSFVKPASSVKSTRALNKKSLPHCRINHRQILVVGEHQADVELYLCKWYECSNCSCRTRHTYPANADMGILLCAFRLRSSRASPSRAFCRRGPTVLPSLMRRSVALNVRGSGTLRWRHFSAYYRLSAAAPLPRASAYCGNV
jgi:hypothetical protein